MSTSDFWLVLADFTWLNDGLVGIFLLGLAFTLIIFVMYVGKGKAANWWRCE